MAGGDDGSLSRCTAKAAAAATGPSGSSTGPSTKRKAAKAPTTPCRTPRPRATKEQKEEEEAAESPSPVAAAGEEKYRLSKAYVRHILALKPMEPPARLAALKRSNPALTPQPGEEADEDKRRLYVLAKAFFEMEESLPATQEWMCSELRSKGSVELDGERAKGRAEVDALIDREWPAIKAKIDALILQDKEYYQGGDESDSDEGEDSDESCDDEV